MVKVFLIEVHGHCDSYIYSIVSCTLTFTMKVYLKNSEYHWREPQENNEVNCKTSRCHRSHNSKKYCSWESLIQILYDEERPVYVGNHPRKLFGVNDKLINNWIMN